MNPETQWTPRGGWNPRYSEQEKIKAIHLFSFFTERKRYPEAQAEVLVHMALWKQKCAGLRYTEEQERELQRALQPIHSVATSTPTW